MDKLKYLMPILHVVNFLEFRIYNLARTILIKLILGIILASVIIFSLTTIGFQVNSIFIFHDKSPYFSIAVYSAIAFVCSLPLTYLFKTKSEGHNALQRNEYDLLEIENGKIILAIFEGLFEGYEKAAKSKTNSGSTLYRIE